MKIEAKDKAAAYLSRRDRSVYEVKSYLNEKEFSNEEIDEAIEYLITFNYLDDERYCENYISYLKNKGKGPLLVKLELKKKGIAENLINTYLKETFNRDYERKAAMKQADKVLDNQQMDDKLLAKIARRLSALGYNSDVIYEIIGQLRKGEESF